MNSKTVLTYNPWIREAQAKMVAKLAWVSESNATGIPYTTDQHGRYDNRLLDNPTGTKDNGIAWWTNGFWPGMMWQLFALTGESKYERIARFAEEALDANFITFDGLHHDVGFMWLPASVADYRLTQSPRAKSRALHAATLLAGRFNLAGSFIRAWNDDTENEDHRGWVIIDSMLNIPLLYWASKVTADPRYDEIARAHANTVMTDFIREDGSVKHICEYDPTTGDYVRSYGGQGFSHGSAWTRWQAWGLYGFTISYEETQDARYLKAAEKIAKRFIERIPASGIIPIDFDQPKNCIFEDSSASAVAACGLIELSTQSKGRIANQSLEAALFLLKILYTQRCDFSRMQENIVTHASGSFHENHHHYAIIYADYYFLEALTKLTGQGAKIW